MRPYLVRAAGILAVLAFAAPAAAAPAAKPMPAHAGMDHMAMATPDTPLAAKVRAANARFQDVAAAVAEGYGPIPCTSGIDGGAMGVHYVNPKYLKDATPDIARPQAVMYEPQADGRMVLVGVEYISFKGPASLEGQLFAFQGAPNRYGLDPFYELHVWAWRPNPKGTFTDMNPNVTCEHVGAHGGA